jgi:hypothetical protein
MSDAGAPEQAATPEVRPAGLTDELIERICEHVAEGASTREIAAMDGMPSVASFNRWLAASEVFREHYARAKAAAMDRMAEEILEIADTAERDTYVDSEGNTRVDNEVIARSRLRVDTRKWLMAKLAPKKYGDAVAIKHSGGIAVAALEMDDEHAKRAALTVLAGMNEGVAPEGGEA